MVCKSWLAQDGTRTLVDSCSGSCDSSNCATPLSWQPLVLKTFGIYAVGLSFYPFQREANFLRMIDRKAPLLYEQDVVVQAIRRYETCWLPMQVRPCSVLVGMLPRSCTKDPWDPSVLEQGRELRNSARYARQGNMSLGTLVFPQLLYGFSPLLLIFNGFGAYWHFTCCRWCYLNKEFINWPYSFHRTMYPYPTVCCWVL